MFPPLSRRDWLRIGGLSALGLNSLNAIRGERDAASFGKAKSCIVLFLMGGPAQHETFDPKPDAVVEVRGEGQAIATNVPGIRLGHQLPRVARHADKLCLLRAVSTNDNAHSSSGYWMLTGQPHQPRNSENSKPGAPNDWPSTAAIVRRLRNGRNGLPTSITLPEQIWNDGNLTWPGQDGGFLGRTADPWLIPCDPSQAGFTIGGLTLPSEVSPLRLEGRLHLLQRVARKVEAAGFAHQYRQAIELVHGKGREAFRLEREPAKLRERYGMNRWGQSVLLARRLIEAGVSLVQVNWTRAAGEMSGSPAWDTHAKHFLNLQRLMPRFDAGFSALLEDLEARGLLDSTLVVVMGEFGRTPRLNSNAGRDHWGAVFSVALAGGGIRGGQIYGASDKIGAYPRDGRVLPQDLQATIFHCLGHRSDTEMHDSQNRPLAITRGQVIRQIFG
ncbi:MAG: DUF1501 domain-containing protein [Gemmataceae bacterium]